MSDTATPGAQGTPQAGAQPGTGDGMIPKARFDEVNERMKAAEARIAEFAQAEEARRQAELKAKGEYETLETQLRADLKAAQEKATAWESYQSSRREALLAGLPDEHRAIADGLELAKLESYAALHGKQQKPPVDPGKPGGAGQPTVYTREQIAEGVKAEGLGFLAKVRAAAGQ